MSIRKALRTYGALFGHGKSICNYQQDDEQDVDQHGSVAEFRVADRAGKSIPDVERCFTNCIDCGHWLFWGFALPRTMKVQCRCGSLNVFEDSIQPRYVQPRPCPADLPASHIDGKRVGTVENQEHPRLGGYPTAHAPQEENCTSGTELHRQQQSGYPPSEPPANDLTVIQKCSKRGRPTLPASQ